ncbi:MAG TPA: Crp/Fnr family transcriptional regulator [Terracidiphilus sp.]|nr:Crp/Fnr family transcriptional regulator [Terracidiphilus sp.]
MSARIIHFGDDRFNRLEPLREAGYRVDAHNTLESFRMALDSGVPCDALTITETEADRQEQAVSIARMGSDAPLIFFQDSTKLRDGAEFNLIVPLLAQPGVWLDKIAELIERGRGLRSSAPQTRSGLNNRGRSIQAATDSRPSRARTPRLAHEGRDKTEQGGTGGLEFERERVSLKTIKASQFLRSLTPDMLNELESITSFSFCAPGTVLYVEGQVPHEVFLLLEGQVKLFMNAHDGRRLTVHIASAGELLGLACVFTSASHKASAETVYPSRLGSVRCDDFMKFLMVHSKAAQAAARELSEACDRTYTRLRTIGVTPSNRAKLARLILEWAAQGKQTERGIQIHLALKHGEIAECIGTCRESVTRILRDLQRWQVIELRGSLLTIADLHALEQCADLK